MTASRCTLRAIITADAATALGMGLLLMIIPETLAALTALPAGLVFYAGAMLLPLGAVMLAIGQFGTASAGAVWLVILGNEAWVVASIVLLLSGWVDPNPIGITLVIAQAVVVAVFAAVEFAARHAAPRLTASQV